MKENIILLGHLLIQYDQNVGHNFIYAIYSLSSTKLGMEVVLWTLKTGKILQPGYLGNGCHGDQKHFLRALELLVLALVLCMGCQWVMDREY